MYGVSSRKQKSSFASRPSSPDPSVAEVTRPVSFRFPKGTSDPDPHQGPLLLPRRHPVGEGMVYRKRHGHFDEQRFTDGLAHP